VQTPLITLTFVTAALTSAVAAWTDYRTGRIPNGLTLPVAALGLILHGALGGVSALGMSALGLAAGIAVPAILYKVSSGKAIGGGDVKLFATLGALLGPTLAIEAQFGAFVLLCVFALIRLTFRGLLFRVLQNSLMLLINPLLPKTWRRDIQPEAMTEMRMGPAIASAVLSTLLVEHFGRALSWLP